MFDQSFLSPQVKRTVIISNKHGKYELFRKLPNDLRNDLTKLENISKISKPQAHDLLLKMKTFSIPAKNS